MNRPLMLAAVVSQLAVSQLCFGRSGYVANALGTVSSRYDTIAPAMLATLTPIGTSGFVLVGTIAYAPTQIYAPPPIEDVRIRPAGATTGIPVNVLTNNDGAVIFVVPAGIPLGGAEILWRQNGLYSATNVTVVRSNFELARRGPAGPAIAKTLFAAGATDVGLASPARPGQTIALAGSGMGYGTQATVTIAGTAATVIYAGRDGLKPGYDQIQVQIPLTTPDGCYVPVAVTVGEEVATSTISVTADGSPCRHPLGLPTSDLRILDTGGFVATGQISMSSDLYVTSDSAARRQESVHFSVGAWRSPDLVAAAPLAPSGCTTLPLAGLSLAGGILSFGSQFGPVPPDLGDSVTLQNGTNTFPLSRSYPNNYAGILGLLPSAPLAGPPPTQLAPGIWSLSLPESVSLAATSFRFAVLAKLQLSGGAVLSLRRDQAQMIEWNARDLDADATVQIYLRSIAVTGYPVDVVKCSARASAGSVTISPPLLGAFEAGSVGSVYAWLEPSGASLPHTVVKTRKGDSLLLFLAFLSSDSRPADFR